MPSAPIRVLFVCTHNSARSQIAEALLQRYGGDDFEVYSAGTEATRVNPLAIQVLGELGIDWSHARSKVIGEFLDQQFDYVITVCDRARATCPVFPGSIELAPLGPRRSLRRRRHGRREARGVPANPGRRGGPAAAVHRGRPARGGPPAASRDRRLRAHLAELIGTFALVFFGCGAIANGLSADRGRLAFGLVIAVMIYALGHISGAHFNPAVSVGFAIGGHMPWGRVVTYVARAGHRARSRRPSCCG